MASSGNHPRPRHIAIVGGGISGIACSWKLRNHDCDVDIYESDDRLGGHANSLPFQGNNMTVNVDTGFIAMDETTYPQFNNFLGELGIQTISTDMSFGVSAANGDFEWGSYSLRSFTGTLWNLFNPWLLRLMFDILRFSLFAGDLDSDERTSAPSAAPDSDSEISIEDMNTENLESIGDYVKRKGYSEQFITYFLIPMVAAPWCIDPDEFARSFPAKKLIQFMQDHKLLGTIKETLRWRSFRNGSKTYVDAFVKRLPSRHQLCLNAPIRRVTRHRQGGVSVQSVDGSMKVYDHVVLAVHANQALDLLAGCATPAERRVLSAFKTRRNVCYLHSDTEFLPKRPSARVAWNCHLDTGSEDGKHIRWGRPPLSEKIPGIRSRISITFDMNKLQAIPFPGEPGSPGRALVTMNPIVPPCAPYQSRVYYHPLPNADSMKMSDHLHRINGVASVSFAGAWMGFGFHEDGFVAGAHAADIIMNGKERCDQLNLVTNSKTNKPGKKGVGELALRFIVSTVQTVLVIMSL